MKIQRIGVIGAGTMGNGIAQVCALAGLDVTMVDVTPEALQRGLATVSSSLDRLVKKDKLQAAEKDAALARIRATVAYEDLAGVQLVIEAATENLELKLRILRQVEAVVGAEAVIASNTSSISISQLAAVLQRVQAECRKRRRIGVAIDAEHAALLAQPVGVQFEVEVHAHWPVSCPPVGWPAGGCSSLPPVLCIRLSSCWLSLLL